MMKFLTVGRHACLGLLLLGVPLTAAADLTARAAPGPATARSLKDAVEGFETRSIEGWTVHINRKLLEGNPTPTQKAIALLGLQLQAICGVVPAGPLAHLQKVVLWVDPEYPHTPPRAEYHPDAGWLREHGRDPRMAKGIEITNVRIFGAESRRMPWFILHELAHAYHDQVLGFDQPDIIAAYKRAVASKSYDAVERFHGDPNRPNTIERAYAMTNEKEYFAEDTEAFFGRNDFFPFTRDQLRKHDPGMFKLLQRVWQVPEADAGG
jgi:hypothetical protein